jgi:hypothetical protein
MADIYKYPEGRTVNQAIAAGDHYGIQYRKGDQPDGWWAGEYAPPGCGSIDEVLRGARKLFPGDIGRRVFIIRIVGGSIGCRQIEECGEAVL